MPRRKTQQVAPSKRVKVEQQTNPSPLRNRLTDNNDTPGEPNGLDQKSDGGKPDPDTNKYLHKKFKKVATLEETSPPNGKARAMVFTVPEDLSNADLTLDLRPGSPTVGSATIRPGYVCPYCKLACAKPSVLQKHIRAHTNERPYPCHPCGFAFKTKSNLYKHCRSRAHSLKMGETDLGYDGSLLSGSGSTSEEEDAKTEVSLPSEVKKIYKPKFHRASFYSYAEEPKSPKPLLQLSIPPPSIGQSTPSPFTSGSSPSPEFLHRHINKLISENQAIVDTLDPGVGWPKKQVRYSKESPPSSPLKNGEAEAKGLQSKLALALLRPFKPASPDFASSESLPLTEGATDAQPLNLSTQKVETTPRVSADVSLNKTVLLEDILRINSVDNNNRNPEGSIIKDILLKTNRAPLTGDSSRSQEGGVHVCPKCQLSFKTSENFEMHLYTCKEFLKRSRTPIKDSKRWAHLPLQSSVPLLGSTPLVDCYSKDGEPNVKKQKRDNSASLRSLEDLSKSPMKSVHLWGGEVHILDSPGGETKTLRIEPSNRQDTSPSYIEASNLGGIKVPEYKEPRILTIAKTGLHSVGGTMIQTQSELHTPKSPVAQSFLQCPGLPTPQLPFPAALTPLTSITAFNPLTLPPTPALTPLKTSNPYNGGVVTILHGGKTIPHVPGIPGPNTLLTSPLVPLKLPVDKPSVIVKGSHSTMEVDAFQKPETTVISTLKVAIPSIRVENEELAVKKPRVMEELLVKTISAKKETTSSQVSIDSEVVEKKFLRPTSLPLKPGTYTPKRHISVPNQVSLVSPETPRPRKSYGQLYLNGHAYTYLGLKCSTRMFFCTLNKPQPIYVPLSPEHNKVSMYSNWKVCSDSNPNPLGLDPGSAMTQYDSRNRSSRYTIANRNKQDVITHSTYTLKKEQRDAEKNDSSEKSDSVGDGDNPKRVRVCDGGFESNEDYIYVRGRGRGRYVCEECGIRCKKPSMLKKHIRTHTDLRPYTCKHCAFSFKTKGNLTKHMKSKAHNKKCTQLDTSPTSGQDGSSVNEDGTGHQDGGLSSQSGPGEESDEDSEEEEDEDDDEESEDEEEGKVKWLAVKSLLSLSEVTPQAAHRQFVTAGLVSGRPRTYPYTLSTSPTATASRDLALDNPLAIMQEKEGRVRRDTSLSESDSDTKSADLCDRTPSLSESVLEPTRPMDLSNKPTGIRTPVISSVGGQASLLATICSTTERLPVTPTADTAEDNQLLHAYLTERAVRDTKMKQHQCHDLKKQFEKPITELESPTELKASSSLNIDSNCQEMELIKPEVSAPLSSSARNSEPEVNFNAKESALGILALTTSDAKKSTPVLSISPNKKLKAEFMPPSSGPSPSYVSVMDDGRSMCGICNKVFNKPSQLRLHVNIHYFERPFRCESCAVSFRTKGHLQKHQRSLSHLNKVNMNSTFGPPTTNNPRPFKCDDCPIAFRIHGHLAKHLRSKMHIMKLECLGKLPFGTYAELERSGMNMNDIDTTDCENSLESLQLLAQKLYEKDPSKLGQWAPAEMVPNINSTSCGETSSEEEDPERRLQLVPNPSLPGVGAARVADLASHSEAQCVKTDLAVVNRTSEPESNLSDPPSSSNSFTASKNQNNCHSFESNFEKCNPTEDGVR